jgi:hypothetical protein
VFGNRPGLVARPRLKRGDKLALIDQTVLKREQTKQKIQVGGRGRHGGGSGTMSDGGSSTRIIATLDDL